MGLEFRKVFDTIPDQFDTYRPRYCAELFADLNEYAGIGPGKTGLELGPGTGQSYRIPTIPCRCCWTNR